MPRITGRVVGAVTGECVPGAFLALFIRPVGNERTFEPQRFEVAPGASGRFEIEVPPLSADADVHFLAAAPRHKENLEHGFS
jgi:hypothetical protein